MKVLQVLGGLIAAAALPAALVLLLARHRPQSYQAVGALVILMVVTALNVRWALLNGGAAESYMIGFRAPAFWFAGLVAGTAILLGSVRSRRSSGSDA